MPQCSGICSNASSLCAGGATGLSVSTSKTADGDDTHPETPAVAASTVENEEVGCSTPRAYCALLNFTASLCPSDTTLRESSWRPFGRVPLLLSLLCCYDLRVLRLVSQGGLDLNIDMSALDIVTSEEFAQQQVFGQKWMVQLVPKRPPDVKPDRILSLAEYRRRLANIVG